MRPILAIDEAQEMPTAVQSEVRLLANARFDSRALLTVVLAGDGRLTARFHADDLQPLASRIRVRLLLTPVWCRERAAAIGPACAKLITTLLTGSPGERVIDGSACSLTTNAR